MSALRARLERAAAPSYGCCGGPSTAGEGCPTIKAAPEYIPSFATEGEK